MIIIPVVRDCFDSCQQKECPQYGQDVFARCELYITQKKRMPMPTLTHVTICKTQDEKFCQKTVYIAVCHYCKHLDLAVFDVEVTGWKAEDYPSTVACGNCGLRGPWGKTEEESVDKWNEMAGLKKDDVDDFLEWHCTPLAELQKRNSPF